MIPLQALRLRATYDTLMAAMVVAGKNWLGMESQI